MTLVIRPAVWPLHEAKVAALDASYVTDRVYRVHRGPFSFRLRVEVVDPPHRGLGAPLGEHLAELRAAAHAVVAQDGDEVVGVAVADLEWSGRVRVQHIYVTPAARGRGVGRALMDSVVAFAVAEGSRCAWLETQASNYPAIQFYRRLGFGLCGLDERFYGPASPDTALFFALDLTGA